MQKKKKSIKPQVEEIEMQEHYDFTSGTRGKYAKKYKEGSNIVLLDPDVAEFFSNPEFLNSTLRAISQILKNSQMSTHKPN